MNAIATHITPDGRRYSIPVQQSQFDALVGACEFGAKQCKAWMRDENPHGDLKRGDSAAYDAACDSCGVFTAALALARGENPNADVRQPYPTGRWSNPA